MAQKLNPLVRGRAAGRIGQKSRARRPVFERPLPICTQSISIILRIAFRRVFIPTIHLESHAAVL